MARFGTWMAAETLCLSTRLLARSSRILTLARSMAILLTCMRAALQRFSTHLPTTRIRQPTGLVLQ